jgi:hypothetical protein
MADPTPFNSKLAALLARRVQGGGSVPSTGMSLAAACVAVERAEQALEGARAQVRAAARREGVKISGLFSESQFVMRGTSERWAEEARAEGHERGREEVVAAYKMLLAPPSGEFAALAQAVRKAIAAGGFKDILGKDQGGAPADAADAGAAEAQEQARVTAEAKVRAEAILAAARLRDSGGPPLPAPTGKAKRILDAARAAHRKMGDDE